MELIKMQAPQSSREEAIQQARESNICSKAGCFETAALAIKVPRLRRQQAFTNMETVPICCQVCHQLVDVLIFY